jgi:hypothetical protein
MKKEQRRWYDKDPVLKEALELLSISTDDTKDQASRFILQMQDQVAADVIERVYQSVTNYEGKGTRWYDYDPVMIRAIELLREAPHHIQRAAAKKLIKAMAGDGFEELTLEEDNESTDE